MKYNLRISLSFFPPCGKDPPWSRPFHSCGWCRHYRGVRGGADMPLADLYFDILFVITNIWCRLRNYSDWSHPDISQILLTWLLKMHNNSRHHFKLLSRCHYVVKRYIMRLSHALRLNNQSNIVSDGILPLGGRYHDKTSALHSEFAQRSHVSQSHTHKSQCFPII